jgi:fatty acid desaturase
MTKSYFLSNDNSNQNNAADLAPPNWFRPKIDAKKIRALMEKSDARALMDTILWLGAMLGFATIAIALWPSWWSAPFWLAYGVLYGSASDSRWHECGHKTAFKTAWMNNIVYHIASFMLSPSPMVWRASHVRHHTDTIIVGRDPEIIAMRPPDLFRILVNVFGILDAYHLVLRMALHASGRIDPQEATYIRPQDHGKVFLVARIWVLIYA